MKKQKQFFSRVSRQRGMTLIEMLIVLGIVGVMLLLIWVGVRQQTGRGRDAKRKDDLNKIAVAFEDYYNDNDCYPPMEVLNNCYQDTFAPYLREIPCDPIGDSPYVYEAFGGDNCTGYRVLVQLENVEDPGIPRVGCDAELGCGYSDPAYNYGVAVGDSVGGSGFSGGAGTQQWACSSGVPNSVCKDYANPQSSGCPQTTYGNYSYPTSGECDSNCPSGGICAM